MVEEYRRLAPEYDRRWARYVEGTVRMTLAALEPARPQDRILDTGCGTGALLAEVGRAFPGARLHGVDLSGSMLRVARKRLGRTAVLAGARTQELPYPDEAFDAVASVSVLHFVPDPLRALREAFRVLRPGGTLVLTDWCRDYLTMKVLDWWLRRRDPAHRRTLDSAVAARLVEEAGFRQVSIDRQRVAGFWGIMTLVGRR